MALERDDKSHFGQLAFAQQKPVFEIDKFLRDSGIHLNSNLTRDERVASILNGAELSQLSQSLQKAESSKSSAAAQNPQNSTTAPAVSRQGAELLDALYSIVKEVFETGFVYYKDGKKMEALDMALEDKAKIDGALKAQYASLGLPSPQELAEGNGRKAGEENRASFEKMGIYDEQKDPIRFSRESLQEREKPEGQAGNYGQETASGMAAAQEKKLDSKLVSLVDKAANPFESSESSIYYEIYDKIVNGDLKYAFEEGKLNSEEDRQKYNEAIAFLNDKILSKVGTVPIAGPQDQTFNESMQGRKEETLRDLEEFYSNYIWSRNPKNSEAYESTGAHLIAASASFGATSRLILDAPALSPQELENRSKETAGAIGDIFSQNTIGGALQKAKEHGLEPDKKLLELFLPIPALAKNSEILGIPTDESVTYSLIWYSMFTNSLRISHEEQDRIKKLSPEYAKASLVLSAALAMVSMGGKGMTSEETKLQMQKQAEDEKKIIAESLKMQYGEQDPLYKCVSSFGEAEGFQKGIEYSLSEIVLQACDSRGKKAGTTPPDFGPSSPLSPKQVEAYLKGQGYNVLETLSEQEPNTFVVRQDSDSRAYAISAVKKEGGEMGFVALEIDNEKKAARIAEIEIARAANIS